jgi:C-terminal processing protease CtpA/Prc
VLINGATASAAESFAYAIQHRGRGKLYGVKSAGHAHISFTSRFDDLFLHLPYARTCDPDTHDDWEGKGLTPDYEVGSPEYIKLIYSEIANYSMTPIEPNAK